MVVFDDSTVISLESVLDAPSSDLFKEFTTYLHQSYCIENLNFWLAAQEYYDNCHRHDELGEIMINLYIKPNSPQEINIPCEMRQTILEFYKQRNFHSHLFDEAAESVLELMRVNSFLPWIQHHSPSTSSLSDLSSSKWSLKRISRRSCSSLDTEIDFSVNNSSVNSGTRYKSMLKRVKNSLLGHHQNAENEAFYTPRSSFSESYWKKSQ